MVYYLVLPDNVGIAGGASSIAASGQTTVSCYGGGGGGIYNSGTAPAGTYGSGAGTGHKSTVATDGSDGTAGQGMDGGDTIASTDALGACGGGASEVGDGGAITSQTYGGAGLASSITGASVTRAGGGGGGNYANTNISGGGAGGGGSGGTGSSVTPETAWNTSGTTNTGSGGGGCSSNGIAGGTPPPGSGGSGVVILRMATAKFSGTVTGSPTETTDGSDTILQFNATGSYTT